MRILQTYYTSCQSGLSGAVGYQFNAVSPGVDDQLQRQVEALSSYDPPDRVGGRPSEAEIEAAPVSLVHRPGSWSIVARLKYVGADFSNRYGNFFSHALLYQEQPDFYPIELWGSSKWRSTESPVTEIPALAAVSAGAIDRTAAWRTVSEFGQDRVAKMVTGAEKAILGDPRRVVLVQDSDEENALAIAAITYYLPAPLVRRMSFTTYNYRPSHADFHVTGTLPDTMVDASASSAEYSFYLFDRVGGVESDVEIHPLVRLLVRCGDLHGVQAFWERAAELGTGEEVGFDDWYPIAVLCALQDPALRPVVDDHESLAVGLRWLADNAGRLPVAEVSELGAAIESTDRLTIDDQVDLLAVARSIGGDELAARCERQLMGHDFKLLSRGEAGLDYEIRTSDARAAALQSVESAFERSNDVGYVIRLHEWARNRGIELRPQDRRLLASRVVTPAALAGTVGFEQLGMDHSEDFQNGVLDALQEAFATDRDGVVRALDRGLADHLDADVLAGSPQLAEFDDISRASRFPDERRACYLRAVRRRHDEGREAEPLIGQFWPEPSLDETIWLMNADLPAVEANELLGRISRTIDGAERRGKAKRFYLDLLANVPRHYVEALPVAQQALVKRTLDTEDLIGWLEAKRRVSADDLMTVLEAGKGAPKSLAALLHRSTVDAVDRMPKRDLAEVLPQLPTDMRRDLSESWQERLVDQDSKLGVQLLEVAELVSSRKLSAFLVDLVDRNSAHWGLLHRRRLRKFRDADPDESKESPRFRRGRRKS